MSGTLTLVSRPTTPPVRHPLKRAEDARWRGGAAPLDSWLRHQLAQAYGGVVDEDLPDELKSLIRQI